MHSYWFIQTLRLDLACGLRVRSVAGSSRIVIAVALWEWAGIINFNWNHVHTTFLASINGLDQIHCSFCWERPCVKIFGLMFVRSWLLSHMSVTVDGVWIGYPIYWPLTDSGLLSTRTSNYNAIPNPHTLQIINLLISIPLIVFC
jgi:hypothetical protein